MTSSIVFTCQVESVKDLLNIVDTYGEKNSVYINMEDFGLSYVNYDEDTIDLCDGMSFDKVPISYLAKESFPHLVVVVG